MSDGQQLLLTFEAKFERYMRNLERAQQTTDRRFKAIEGRAKQAGDRMEKTMAASSARINSTLAGLGSAFMGGFAGGIFAGGGAVGIARGIRNLVRETAALADEAARAGMSVETFQEWKAVAEDMRIPIDAVADAFKELNIRGDEFATTGKGSAAEAFERLGMTPQEIQQKLKNPSDLMLELINRTRRLKDTAAATRIFDELFGGAGAERMVRLLNLGEGAIEDIIDAAHESGRVIDDEMIAKADEFDRAWSAAWSGFEAGSKNAIMNTITFLGDLQSKMTEIANSDFFLWLVGKLDSAGLMSLDINQDLVGPAMGRSNVAGLERQITQLESQRESLRQIGESTAAVERQIATARAALETEVQAVMANTGRGTIGATELPPVEVTASPTPTRPADKPASGGRGRRGGGGGAARENGFAADLAAAQRRIELMRQETQLLAQINPLLDQNGTAADAARLKAELLASAQEHGIAVTPALANQIDAVSAAYGQAANEAARLAESQDAIRQSAADFANLAGGVVSGFVSDLRNGVSASEAMANALGKVVDSMIDMMIQALIVGPLMKMFGFSGGGLVGGSGVPGFATGGYTGHGGRYEPAGIVHRGEYVFDKAATSRIGVANLEAIRSGQMPGYANGGYVGEDAGRNVARLLSAGNDNAAGAPSFTINAPVTVNGSAGTPEQNADLARKIAKQMEATMRGVAADEMRRQMRPGNMGNTRSR